MAADYATFKGSYNATNADKRDNLKPANCEHLYAVGGSAEPVRSFSLVVDNELPMNVVKEGYIFKGWTDGTNVYSAITAAELSGKTLKPALVKIEYVEVTPETFAEKLAAAKEGTVLKLAAGEYAGIEITNPYVTIAGPNAGVAGTAEGRAAEAVFTSQIKVSANGVTLDGIQLGNNAQVEIAAITLQSLTYTVLHLEMELFLVLTVKLFYSQILQFLTLKYLTLTSTLEHQHTVKVFGLLVLH
jgi:hypothetical protein